MVIEIDEWAHVQHLGPAGTARTCGAGLRAQAAHATPTATSMRSGNHFGGSTLAAGACVSCENELCDECDVAEPKRCLKCQTAPYWRWDAGDWPMIYQDGDDCKEW